MSFDPGLRNGLRDVSQLSNKKIGATKAYITQTTASSSDQNDLVCGERRKFLGVNGRVDIPMHCLRELEGSGHHVWVKLGTHYVVLKNDENVRFFLVGCSEDWEKK